MLSVSDIAKLTKVFATKQDLQDLKEELREELASKDDFRQVMTTVDVVLGEVKAMRTEIEKSKRTFN